MHFRIGADLGKKGVIWVACRNSHGNGIGFQSAISPACEIQSKLLFLPEWQTLGLKTLLCPTTAAESCLFLRNCVSLVSLKGACLETAWQLLWRWLYLLSPCSSPARGLFIKCQQKRAEKWRWQSRGTKYLSVHQPFAVAQEIARGQPVRMRQQRKPRHTRVFRIRQIPERTG